MKTLTLEDLDRIDQLAEQATPGPYHYTATGDEYVVVYRELLTPDQAQVLYEGGWASEFDAQFTAALDPDTVRALVALARENLQFKIDNAWLDLSFDTLAKKKRSEVDAVGGLTLDSCIAELGVTPELLQGPAPHGISLLRQMTAESQAAGLYDDTRNPLIREEK